MQAAIHPSAQYFVYSADEKHVGPVSAELIGRGVVAGKVPEDAYVAPIGSTNWAPLAAYPDIVDAMRTNRSSIRPSASFGAITAPTPPPAPPVPRDLAPISSAPIPLPSLTPVLVPPPAPVIAPEAQAITAPAPAPLEAKKEEKKEEKKPALDPKWKLLPVAVFGAFGFLAVLETAIVLIARR